MTEEVEILIADDDEGHAEAEAVEVIGARGHEVVGRARLGRRDVIVKSSPIIPRQENRGAWVCIQEGHERYA